MFTGSSGLVKGFVATFVIYDSNRGESKVATTPETAKKLKQDNKVDKSRDFPVFSTPTMFPRPTMGKGGSNKCNNRRTMGAAKLQQLSGCLKTTI